MPENSKSTPGKRRKVEALGLASESRSTQAAVEQFGISPTLLYRWQPAQFVAEIGRAEEARVPEVRPQLQQA